MLEKLETAQNEVAAILSRLTADHQRLEARVADIASLRQKHQEIAEAHEKMAAEARKREATIARMGEIYTLQLQGHDHAVSNSSVEVEALARRRDETAAYLTRCDEDGNSDSRATGEPLPEVAMILSYKLP